MATVPGPRPDRPLPTPGVPAERPEPDQVEEERQASPGEGAPSWEPQPYDPEREHVEPAEPAGVP